MRAMLLCAGLSTRLGPLGAQCPKPLLPVCDIPIVRFGIANLVAQGVTDIVINLHYRGDQFREQLGDGSDLGARLHYFEEDPILGTGGALKNALPVLDPDGKDEPFLSCNGKLIFNINVAEVTESFARTGETLGTMVVRKVPNAMTWGAVDVDVEGRVRNILSEGGYMFCGVHMTRPSVVAKLPDGEACMVRQGYLPWIREGALVTAHVVDDSMYFAEHSTPERYLQSSIDLLSGATIAHPPGNLAGIDATATIDPSATIRQPVRIGAGASIGAGAVVGPNVVVGRNAIVAANSELVDTVVWPGVIAEGSHRQSTVTPDGPIAG